MTSAASLQDGGQLISLLGDRPVAVAEVELAEGLRSLRTRLGTAVKGRMLFVLARLHSAPLGYLLLADDAEDPAAAWSAAARSALGDSLDRHLDDDGLEPVDGDLWEPVAADGAPHCLAARRKVLENASSVTVIIATKDRPDKLAACLDTMAALDYPNYDIVVVDNNPSTDETEQLVMARAAHEPRLSYCREPRPGLGVAHNCGLAVATGSLVAFTDDDVAVDPHWLSELVIPFVEDPNVAGASGLILPAELETTSQRMLEIHGRFGKGFEPRLYDLGANRPDDVLFPFAAGKLGSGANMAFDTAWLRSVGGFDPATGVGTTAKGGDDLLSLFRVIAAGRTLAYRPGALVWHYHHRDPASLRRQAYGYGVGLGAYLAAAAVHEPGLALSMMRRVPAGIAYLRGRNDEAQIRPDGWPRDLTRLERKGLLYGPFAYALSRWRTRPQRVREVSS